eukprot:SM000071S21130  [mRNA]  locus=s71:576428:578425:- [translate_table: standard]
MRRWPCARPHGRAAVAGGLRGAPRPSHRRLWCRRCCSQVPPACPSRLEQMSPPPTLPPITSGDNNDGAVYSDMIFSSPITNGNASINDFQDKFVDAMVAAAVNAGSTVNFTGQVTIKDVDVITQGAKGITVESKTIFSKSNYEQAASAFQLVLANHPETIFQGVSYFDPYGKVTSSHTFTSTQNLDPTGGNNSPSGYYYYYGSSSRWLHGTAALVIWIVIAAAVFIFFLYVLYQWWRRKKANTQPPFPAYGTGPSPYSLDADHPPAFHQHHSQPVASNTAYGYPAQGPQYGFPIYPYPVSAPAPQYIRTG